jgi:prophage regulatory protein
MGNPPARKTARIIRAAERRRRVPFSDMHIWRLEQAGKFPKRIKLGDRRVGWDLDEVIAWIESRKALREVKP